MAFNELNVARLDRFVRRLTGIRQPGVLSAVMGELATVLPIPQGPEDDQPAGRVPWGASVFVTQNGAIGDYMSIAIENTLPGHIVTVGGLLIVDRQQAAAGAPTWRHYLPGDSRTLGPAIAGGVQPRDGRSPLVPTLRRGNVASGSPAGRNIAAFPVYPVVGTEMIIPLPWLVLPPAPASSGTGFPGVAEYRCGELTAVGTDTVMLHLYGWSREMDSSEDAS